MDIRVQLSSCVPSTHMETTGARLEAADLVPLMDHPRVIGLAEFMNFPGVLFKDAGCLAKLEAFAGRHIDGHAPLLRGNDLNGYISAGIRTEHEATTARGGAGEAAQGDAGADPRRVGVSKDLHALAPMLTERHSPYLCLCTDDRNPLDIARAWASGLHDPHGDRAGLSAAGRLSRGEPFGGRGVRAEGPRADRAGQAGRYRGDRHAGRVPCLAGALRRGRGAEAAAYAAREVVPPVARHSVKAPPVAAAGFPHWRATGRRRR